MRAVKSSMPRKRRADAEKVERRGTISGRWLERIMQLQGAIDLAGHQLVL
jgi:hypothetical protein